MTQNKLKHEQIQYIEFVSKDIVRAKNFYTKCFDWKFIDYGPKYSAFEGDYIDGGFTYGKPINGSILVILIQKILKQAKAKW